MSLPRIVVDNSAILPAFFPEPTNHAYDAGLVTNRARSLVHAIRMRKVNAYVPPSFFREFLNVGSRPIYERGGRFPDIVESIRVQWDDLLSLPLIVVPLNEILHQSGILVFEEFCPASDSWYVSAALHARATFWMSHEHTDDLATIASQHVEVRQLAKDAPQY